MDNPVLVNLWRGSLIESSHHGRIAVMDANGIVVFSAGDIDAPVFPRSAVKAFQALPLIETGAADKYKLTSSEIALACASHSGDDIHVAAASSMLAKAGLDVNALECGAHWPMDTKVAGKLIFICCSCFNQRQSLKGLDCGARKYWRVYVAS